MRNAWCLEPTYRRRSCEVRAARRPRKESHRECVGIRQSNRRRPARPSLIANVPDARDVAPLPGAHVAKFPQANRLGFFAGANCWQKFLFKQQHPTRSEFRQTSSPGRASHKIASTRSKSSEFCTLPTSHLPLQATCSLIIRDTIVLRWRSFRPRRSRGCSSVGRARRCQRRCRRFESDHPLLDGQANSLDLACGPRFWGSKGAGRFALGAFFWDDQAHGPQAIGRRRS